MHRLISIAAIAAMVTMAIGPARAEDIATAHPKNVKVEFENAQVRVMRVTIAPHEKLDLHEVRDAVAVPLTSYMLVMTDKDGKTVELKRKAGKPEWVAASERVTEAGDRLVDAILVELKGTAP